VGKTLAKPPVGNQAMPEQIRVSVGSAIVLGLLEGKLDAEPTTTYLMTYRKDRCTANCGFCPQARTSQSKAELLSRVSWPAFSARSVIRQIGNAVHSGKTKRVCIQALNYPEVFAEICAFIKALKRRVSVPVSVSCQPQTSQNIWDLAHAGADRIGIAIDASTEKLFNQIKGAAAAGPYSWENEFLLLRTAIGVFGEGNVSTHLIIGLGETEKEAVQLLQDCVDMGVLPALFAFTPVRGTALADNPKPPLEAYRRIQLARYLVVESAGRFGDMAFGGDGEIVDFGVDADVLISFVETGNPFLTSGCPDCNRPFYNEKPSGPLYNYPKKPNPKEIAAIKQQLTLNKK
jgi:biotin synthase